MKLGEYSKTLNSIIKEYKSVLDVSYSSLLNKEIIIKSKINNNEIRTAFRIYDHKAFIVDLIKDKIIEIDNQEEFESKLLKILILE